MKLILEICNQATCALAAAAFLQVGVTNQLPPIAGGVFGPSMKFEARDWGGDPTIRSAETEQRPVFDIRLHYVGELWYAITNEGPVGYGPRSGAPLSIKDKISLRIDWTPCFEFPEGSRIDHVLDGGLVFGCIQGLDTLVSSRTGFGESSREFSSFDTIAEASLNPSSRYYIPTAFADQEYHTLYSDTAILSFSGADYIENREHKPIGIEVNQSSYSWSDELSKRFVIVDNWIKNISARRIESGAVGIFLDPEIASDLYESVHGASAEYDDICGFLRAVPGVSPGTVDTIDGAWAADNDGDPVGGQFVPSSPRSVIGVRILRAPPGGQLSFNWWATDFSTYSWGPRRAVDVQGFAGSQGVPLGDRNRYKMMVNGEIDYDQVFSAIDQQADGWSPPPTNSLLARNLARGVDIYQLLSYGPLPDIAPGDSIPFTFAMIAGANFHNNPRNFLDHFDPLNPKKYLDGLNFSDLITNARYADWTFDNPGVDTDGDGYRGKFYLVDCKGVGGRGPCDTVWCKGDGVPDWRPLHPSLPSPSFKLVTRPHEATLRWDGALTETTKGVLSHRRDFEGYRVYTARLNVTDQFSLVSSWDENNFTRWSYDSTLNDWKQISYPLTVPQWQSDLNNPSFDPVHYSQPSFQSAYRDTFIDTVRDVEGTIIKIACRERYSYWLAEGPNRGNSYYGAKGEEINPIQRVAVRDTVVEGDSLTYGVYEVTIGNLNGGVPLYFSVTAFDFGDYAKNVPSIESSPSNNAQYGFPIYEAEVVTDSNLKVSVYPNPYKSRFRDAFGNWQSYHSQGYEAPGRDMTVYDRRIWFINLPDTATIRIYTLDGDLVREINHPDKFLTTYSSAVGWDLISRNTQEVESGIYIYRVDSRLGAQIGKIVIIK